jgi:hypothetical protein
MLTSSVYEYNNERDSGYMMRFINSENKIFRFFSKAEYGDNAHDVAEITLAEFIKEFEPISKPIVKEVKPSKQTQQKMLVTKYKGIYTIEKNNKLIGFAVKNGRTNRISFFFSIYSPEECWRKVLELRSMYDETCDITQPMPELDVSQTDSVEEDGFNGSVMDLLHY